MVEQKWNNKNPVKGQTDPACRGKTVKEWGWESSL